MVSDKNLLNDIYWKIPFTVHTDASDKQLGAVIINKNNPIDFFSIVLSKPQHNYNTIEKELLTISERLKQFQGIIFGYKINLFSDNKNLVYAASLSESQRVMRWRPIIGEFGPNIQHISGVEKIIDDTISRLPYKSINKYNPITMKA